MIWLRQLFRRIEPAEVVEEQLHDAKLRQLEHRAAAEHHQALAEMYGQRITRLQTEPLISGDAT